MATIYDQQWTAGTFNHSTYYQSSNFGGAGTPDPNYPELAAAEKAVISGGVLTSTDSGDYTVSSVVLLEFGNLSGGYWDATSGWAEVSYTPLSTAPTGSTDYRIILRLLNDFGTLGGVVIQLAISEPSSGTYAYELTWETFANGAGNIATNTTFAFDNNPHVARLEWTCGTVTGDFDDVAEDGSLRLLIDDVEIYEITGIDLFFNRFDEALTQPNKAYGAALGNAGFVGTTSRLQIGDNTVTAIRGSAVFGADVDVTADNAIAFGLDGDPHVHAESGKLKVFGNLSITGYLELADGITAPATPSGAAAGMARIYIDSADGDLKIKFADGTVKTITTDT